MSSIITWNQTEDLCHLLIQETQAENLINWKKTADKGERRITPSKVYLRQNTSINTSIIPFLVGAVYHQNTSIHTPSNPDLTSTHQTLTLTNLFYSDYNPSRQIFLRYTDTQQPVAPPSEFTRHILLTQHTANQYHSFSSLTNQHFSPSSKLP